MHKRLPLLLVAIALSVVQAKAQAKTAPSVRRIDTVAVAVLDRMSKVIGELGSCSFTVRANYDISSRDLGLIKHSDEEQLFLHGPDKLLWKTDGDRGSRDFYFDGKQLSYYSHDKNQYGQIDASMNIVEMIDTVNKLYGIDFPAADFLYPTFVDDILSESKELAYLGLTRVEGKECYHIAGRTADKTFQFWISDDAFSLPLKLVIVYTSREMNPQYEAILTDWQVNPNLPDALFDFSIPHKATRVKLLPMSAKK
ncbi:MAG TPA: DUF2092 domain-containing protein [Puia sp.]|jgi:hypothetical protein|nr:DUF2092 domain-containing protein [Puia sp.]